ncbi:energy transducer TonB [Novosphingobium sp. BW1]|uniref:energy transducer TonB n=1 Tax=Novosphingobium sp. BW1 TaxID=2592621 RepID=UPI0011DEB538|nr:energy transducer TonB [Novosphingobium sp. BW1]TYC81558.1 energy transducer TonB [Novosphingobium sp. BW1]
MLMLLGLGTQQARQHVQNHVVAINLNGAKPTKPDTPAPSPEPEKLASSVTPQPAVTVLPPPARILVHEPTAPAALAPAALVTMPAAAPAIPAAPPADRPSAVASANSGTPATTSGNISGIRMLSGNPPSYPYESRRKKEQGTVRLHLLLGTDGRVETIGIASSSGFARLDKAALKAVKHWRWEPVVRNGKPVRIEGELEIPFVLNT